MKLERFICVDVNTATVHGSRRAARALTGPVLSRFMVSRGGTGGIFGPDLNHDWSYEELIRRAVEQQSGDCVVFSRSTTTQHCASYDKPLPAMIGS